jgi:OOP family OmpA-OmpF porin
MNSPSARALIIGSLLFAAVPAFAQEPGKDEEGCKPSALMSRMPGCGIYECSKKDFDSFDAIINKAAETKALEGEVEQLKMICPLNASQLQLLRNAEAALRKSGYVTEFTGKHSDSEWPVVTAHKGAQWLIFQTENFNEFPAYTQTAVLVKEMAQEMSATAQAMSDAIAKSGRLDVYGITFATGQAAITPASDQVLSDVLAVLTANPDWRLQIQGHTDNVGDKAANLKLSAMRAAAVATWLTQKGIDAGRLAVQGYGDTQPMADNATEDGRARNRRVVLVKQ